MPKIERLFTLEITPNRFVEACSQTELLEVYILANARLNRLEKQEEFRKKRESEIIKNEIINRKNLPDAFEEGDKHY